MSKYIELAKKINELAKNGTGGEKENAEKMLRDLMEKHGLKMSDIEGEEHIYHYIKVSKDKEQFFYQIASTVVGKGYKEYYKDKNEKGFIVIKAKAVDALMIEAKFDFYCKAYDEDLKIFYQAFIKTNNLYPCNSTEIDRELTKEELEELNKVRMMSIGMESKSFFKQLK